MGISLSMRRGLGLKALVCLDEAGEEMLTQLPFDTAFVVKISQPRNSKHHRLFFTLMNEVYKNQTTFATLEGMLDAIKVAIGHCDERVSVTGTKFYVPRSISFAAMDQTAFRQFYDKAVDVILNHILPHTKKADLEQRLCDIMKVPGPDQLNR